MKTLFALLAFTLTATFAQARDLYDLRVLGFSEDGKYHAFLQTVEKDGSGFKTAIVQVVDVDANKLVKNVKVVLENDDATLKQAIKKALVRADLAHFGINQSRRGEILLERSLHDRSSYTNTVFSTSYYRLFEVLVTKTATAEDATCLSTPELVKVAVKKIEEVSAPAPTPETVLQEDVVLPKSRKCAYGYEVARVTRLNDKLVILLRYKTPGFEGADVQYMVVTGKLDLN